MTATVLALTAVFLTGPLGALEEGEPALRPSGGGATAFVKPPHGPFSVLRPDGPALEPGSLVEVGSGTALFEASFGARVEAPAGSGFRFGVPVEGGPPGLSIAVVSGSAPVALVVAGVRLPLWKGDSVAFYEDGRVELGGGVRAAEPEALLAAHPAAFDAQDPTVRNALAASPAPAARLLETFPVPGEAPAAGKDGDPWPTGGDPLLLGAAIAGLALLAVVEGARL